MKIRDILGQPSHPQHAKAAHMASAIARGNAQLEAAYGPKILAVDGAKTTAGMTYMQKQDAMAALRAHLNQAFDLMAPFGHVDELDPVTRELFRDMRGTLNGRFMEGVS